MKFLVVLCFSGFLGLVALTTAFAETEESAVDSPIVVELFTSQSCSSCPSADTALREIVRENRSVIALSCHVTYWDHLSWKDTLSQKACTERQRRYAQVLGNGRRIYTPQMVVNGDENFVGSDRKAAAKAIASAGRVHSISVSIGSDNKLRARLPKLSEGDYEIQIFGYKNRHLEDVRSGENRGKHLRYINSVTFLGSAQAWDGTALEKEWSIPDRASDSRPIDGFTLLAQSLKTGAILAAGNWSAP